MTTAKVTAKGQVTVPRDVREALGIETGDRIEFLIEDGRVTVRATSRDVRELRGLIAAGPSRPVSVEEMNAAIEGEAAKQCR